MINKKNDPVVLLDLWKDEMVRRLVNTGIEAMRPSLLEHAKGIVKELDMQVQKDFDIQAGHMIVRLYGRCLNVEEWMEINTSKD